MKVSIPFSSLSILLFDIATLWIYPPPKYSITTSDKTDFLVFLKNREKGQFIIERTSKSLMLYEIIKNYQFLWNDTRVEDSEKEIIEPNNFILNEIQDKKENQILYIQKEENKNFKVCNIYYQKDCVYKYNLLNKQLIKVNPRDIRLELANIFELEVNK